MKVIRDSVLTALDGKDIQEIVVGADGRVSFDASGNPMLKSVTLKNVAVDALLRQHKDEPSPAQEVKLTRWELASRIH